MAAPGALKAPTGQHAPLPALLKVSALQAMQDELLLAPVAFWCVFAGQGVGEEEKAVQNCPAGHSSGTPEGQ